MLVSFDLIHPRKFSEERFQAGQWRRIRYFRNDTEKLKNISIQAHRNAGLGLDDVIHSVVFDTRSLTFAKVEYLHARLRVDVIIYSVERAPENYFFITKGLRLGCVHYLRSTDDQALSFELGNHVCGVILPSKEPMLNFLKRF